MLHVSQAESAQRGEWNLFVAAAPTGSFLQSWEWGAFQEAAGFPIYRLFVTDDNREKAWAVCLLVGRPLPFSQQFLYAPWGPVLGHGAPHPLGTESLAGTRGQRAVGHGDTLRDILLALREHVEKFTERSPVFIRIEPRLAPDETARAAFIEAGFAALGRGVQPKDTLIVDLTRSEDDLLRDMHPKTRYNIRIAIRHGVVVDERTTDDGLSTFLTLARDVERRGRFRYHPDAYYGAMLRTLGGESGMFRVLVASHKGLPLAAALFVSFGGTMTYAHGASSVKRPHVMAPTMLHWEAIRRAKESGMFRYDFFGVAPRQPAAGSRPPDLHPWTGVTRFKRGFGGHEERTIGIADCALDPVRYRFYAVARGLRGVLHH